jgi:hypothetical protein
MVSLLSDKFSALAGLVRKYVLALKSGHMAAMEAFGCLHGATDVNCVLEGTKFFPFGSPLPSIITSKPHSNS